MSLGGKITSLSLFLILYQHPNYCYKTGAVADYRVTVSSFPQESPAFLDIVTNSDRLPFQMVCLEFNLHEQSNNRAFPPHLPCAFVEHDRGSYRTLTRQCGFSTAFLFLQAKQELAFLAQVGNVGFEVTLFEKCLIFGVKSVCSRPH